MTRRQFTHRHFLTLAIAVAITLSASIGTADAQVASAPPEKPMRRIHVLIAADTACENVGEGVAVDVRRLESAFRELIQNPDQLVLKTLNGRSLKSQSVFDAIETFSPGYNDAFLFFFSGHANHNHDGHCFGMDKGESIYRDDVVAAMQRSHARLVSVISNGCNTYSCKSVPRRAPSRWKPQRKYVFGKEDVSPIVEALFLDAFGTVNVNGASEGQYTLAATPRGSTSLRPFCDTLLAIKDDRPTWEAFIEKYDDNIAKEYARRRGPDAKCHKARVWSLPTYDRGVRLGVTVGEHDAGGVRIVRVAPGYPATRVTDATSGDRFSLQTGDTLLSINGVPIDGLDHFANLVTTSPPEMEITLKRAASNAGRRAKVRLRQDDAPRYKPPSLDIPMLATPGRR